MLGDIHTKKTQYYIHLLIRVNIGEGMSVEPVVQCALSVSKKRSASVPLVP